MNSKHSALLRILFAASLLAVSVAQAEEQDSSVFPSVSAIPSFHDFGSVKAPSHRMVTITFQNNSNTAVPYFNTYCSGDMSAFSCSSFCFNLPPYGTCSVQVSFYPRSGDDLRRSITVHGSGGGAFAQAHVSGTDAR